MNKKAKIIQTTMELITQQGFHASPMSQIAREAGVAAGTIYHYFPSKDELIRSAYKEVKKQMGDALMYNFDGKKTYKEQFFSFWENLFLFFINNPLIFNFLEQYHHSPFINEQTKEEGQTYYQPVLDFFREGIDKQKLIPLDLELISNLIYGNIVTVSSLHLRNELKITQEKLQMTIEASWNSIANN
jgi:AcrR family transcriptional regulator